MRILSAAFILLLLLFSSGCSNNTHEANLKKAQKIFDRVEPGMSHEDACWYFGMLPMDGVSKTTYTQDVGQSFSKKELQVTLFIRGNQCARVEIVQPHYEGRTRVGGKETVLKEKGISRTEA